jgi:hypothetical protein
MRITSFHAANFMVGLEHDGREIVLAVPFDAFKYTELMARAYREHGVTLPYLSQYDFGEMLQRFVADAVAEGVDLGPISRVHRIVTGDDEPQKH